jgi:hypothetical protein
MNDSTIPLLRGAGGLILLIVAIVGADISNKATKASDDLLRGTMHFDTSKPFSSLTEEEKKARPYNVAINYLTEQIGDMHYDMQKKSIVSAVTKDPWLSKATFLGSALVVLSYFSEWFMKRKKD